MVESVIMDLPINKNQVSKSKIKSKVRVKGNRSKKRERRGKHGRSVIMDKRKDRYTMD